MDYKPVTAVWEITMGCNMRCKHCGSSCEEVLPDELTTGQALKLCDDLGKLGFKYITLSGGEPTTRADWNLIAKRLHENNIIPNMISNGWLIDNEVIRKIKESKINTVAISIDGVEETHDFMRKRGSFKKDMDALELMKNNEIKSFVVTTINKTNIKELDEIKEILINKGVKGWQLQFGLPMGNLKKNCELVIEPEQVDEIIDFAYRNLHDNRIAIYCADCIGYYNKKELEIKKSIYNDKWMWHGCGAGKTSIGILYNGDIVGCTSVRDKSFIEGNIKKTSIVDLWNNPNSFKWNRQLKKSDLKGLCSKCRYGSYCLGGCTNTRICTRNDIHSENIYCSYNVHMKKIEKSLDDITDMNSLYNKAKELINVKQFQVAEILINKMKDLGNMDEEILELYNYLNGILTDDNKVV